jgi:hypothetical protein
MLSGIKVKTPISSQRRLELFDCVAEKNILRLQNRGEMGSTVVEISVSPSLLRAFNSRQASTTLLPHQ